jgi:hypothetical protein
MRRDEPICSQPKSAWMCGASRAKERWPRFDSTRRNQPKKRKRSIPSVTADVREAVPSGLRRYRQGGERSVGKNGARNPPVARVEALAAEDESFRTGRHHGLLESIGY